MSSFLSYKSVQRLLELSEHPVNLTEEAVLSSKRIEKMQMQSSHLKLLYATERLGENTLEALWELAKESEALQKMQRMQRGEVINIIEGYPSEQRAVLHTATRDFFEPCLSSACQSAAEHAYKELEKLTAFLKDIEQNQLFTHIVQVGIGGSDLGPRAVYLALKAYKKSHREAHFIANVDPDDSYLLLSQLDLKKTLFVIVSKSGSTIETASNEEIIREHLQQQGLDPRAHMVAVTCPGSPLDDTSRYLERFYIWDYVGGRYSVTSMVGAVVLAFTLGMDKFLDFLKGASLIDKIALKEENNLPLLSALLSIWNRNFLHYSTQAIIPYSQALERFPAHLQQLNMESNGKGIDKKGAFIAYDTGAIYWGEPGTCCQHSFFQLLHQGTSIVPVEFIGFTHSQYPSSSMFMGTTAQQKLLANLLAQAVALATGQRSYNPGKVFEGNRPSRILLAERLDPMTMGALLSYYEHAAAFQGFIWNINSFDQEGVQLGKVLASSFCNAFEKLNQGKDIDAKDPSPVSSLMRQVHKLL